CVGDKVRVVDFGVATKAGKAGSFAGTLEYMAPEVLRGKPPGAAADLYAVGVIATELLSNEAPKDVAGDVAGDVPGDVSADLFAESAQESAELESDKTILAAVDLARWKATRIRIAAQLRRVQPVELRKVLSRLLLPDPLQRLAAADEALLALQAAV